MCVCTHCNGLCQQRECARARPRVLEPSDAAFMSKSALVSVTLFPNCPAPAPAIGSHDGGGVVAAAPSTETIHVVLPLRPSQCTVGALCEKLFGTWDARAFAGSATTLPRMTENERRLARYRAAAEEARIKAGGPVHFDGFGHPSVIHGFLPSHASVLRARRAGDEAGDNELCRASEALDRERPANTILLRDGQTLELHEVDPDTELDTNYRQIDQMVLEARAKASTLSPGGGGRKKPTTKKKKGKESLKNSIAATPKSAKIRQMQERSSRSLAASETMRKMKMTASMTSTSAGSSLSGRLDSTTAADSDDELDYGYGTALLMSVRTAYYFVLVRWVVGDGETMRIGPLSARHTVADLAVLVQRRLAIEVSKQRITFRGRLLDLGQRLGRLGLVNEHVTDPLLLSKVDEGTFEAAKDGAGRRADEKSVGEKVVF